MSHQPEREEKNCLNCGTIVQGRYCHVCGQENIVTKESFFSLAKHFVYDILHFDSQFFDTLKFLLFRPGFLSKQYAAGKRVSYLNPIRMYLFTSFLFFLIVLTIRPTSTSNINFGSTADTLTRAERLETLGDLHEALNAEPGDKDLQKKIALLEDTTKPVLQSQVALKGDQDFISFKDGKDSAILSVMQYDSIQKALPAQKQDGWFKKMFFRRILALKEKYGENPNEGLQRFAELFVHRLPYLLFLSLPFFALILKLLYIRRKSFYYSDHAIFTLHHYIFSFILLLLIFLASIINGWLHFKVFNILMILLIIAWPVYLFAAMRNFYRQGWAKTFSKFLLLNLMGFMVLLLLFVVFLFFTFFQI